MSPFPRLQHRASLFHPSLGVLLAGLAASSTASPVLAQFVESNPGLPESTFPCVEPGDFDHDGDVDVLVAGEGSQGVVYSTIYRNTNGAFVSSGLGLVGLQRASAAWGDFDHDGDLDLAMTGLTVNTTTLTRVYRNDGTAFVALPGPFTNVYGGRPAWGDYDGDLDLDLIVTGVTAQFFPAAVVTTRLYRNDNGAFTSVPHPFQDTYLGPAEWIDYDQDGDMDLFLGGSSASGGIIATLWRNDAGTFVDAGANLPGVSLGFATFGDTDRDGDLDLLLGGSTNLGYQTFLFRYSAGTYSDAGAGFLGMVWSDGALGDYDQDGDLDALVMGYDPVLQVSRTVLYRNTSGSFVDSGIGFHDLYLGSVDWFDVDLDGDLDFLIAGNDIGNDLVRLYRNTRSSGAMYCFGDGSGTACPCGNAGLQRSGCANSTNAGGARLSAGGVASIGADSLVLVGTGMPNGPTLYFQGTARVANGSGSVFGDGLLCAGGSIVRLGVEFNVHGASRHPAAGAAPISVQGQIGSAGSRTYQAWYRDAAAFCDVEFYNLTSAAEVSWTP